MDDVPGIDVTSPKHPNRISEIRKARHIKVSELAEACGCNPSQITKLERSETTLSQDWLYRVSRALNVQPFELLPEWADAANIPLLMQQLFALLPPEKRDEAIERLMAQNGGDPQVRQDSTGQPDKARGKPERLIEVTVRDDGSYHAVVFYRPKRNFGDEEPQEP